MNDNDFSFTENGSLYSEQYGDVYYTDGKGKEESLYVFLDANQVQNRLNSREKLVIGELGFGTGLNFLLCWQAYLDSGGDQGLDFVSFELHPLPGELIHKAISQWPELLPLAEQLIIALVSVEAGYNSFTFGDLRLHLYCGDVNKQIDHLELMVGFWMALIQIKIRPCGTLVFTTNSLNRVMTAVH